MRKKALLIPYNSKRQIYIQDRSGHKPPPWGFFGGSIDPGETAVQAVIREAEEELDIRITTDDLIELGNLPTVYNHEVVERNFFLYKTEQERFNVLEGAGGYWMEFGEAAKVLIAEDDLLAVRKKIENCGL